MQTLPASYPPPLSSPPTVETLERLLAGLAQPLDRGVPTPPTVDLADEGRDEESLDDDHAPVDADTVASAAASDVSALLPTLTWSAHGADARTAGRRARTSLAVLLAVGAAAVAAGAVGVWLP